ncbi:MAG: TrmB family transcriptional regulator [Halobacteriota archaeon]
MPEEVFIARLQGFGLTEKEAQCYFHLLKYGPKTPSPLARALRTYREDVHRTLNGLIDKDMVRPSLDSPTVYTAVALDTALEIRLRRQEEELHELKKHKRDLQELVQRYAPQPSNEVTFRMLKSVRDFVNTALPVILSADHEILWLAPAAGLAVISRFGINDAVKEFIECGARCRGITDMTYSVMPLVQEALDNGEDVRHFPHYRGVYFAVCDRLHCLSAINIDIKHVALDEPASMLYTDDPVYAAYLISTFEMLWEQAIPAEAQIQDLLERERPHI